MDDRRFDSLTKTLAADGSRRRFLKGLLGLGGAAVVAGSATTDPAQAARRPTPTPKPVHCPGQQTWNGSACVCPSGRSNCGPDCCNPNGTGANYSECCDNACCFGTCYGEELCCAYPSVYCAETGECCPAGGTCCSTVGCITADQCCFDADCQQYPNSFCDTTTLTCSCTPSTCASLGNVCGALDDGCGGSTECGCPVGQLCSAGQCVDDPDICVAGEDYCTAGTSALCGGGACFCTSGMDGSTYCIPAMYEGLANCSSCATNADCIPLTNDPNAVCVAHNSACGACTELGSCAPRCSSG